MTKSKASQPAEMKNKGKLPAGITKTKTTQGRQKIKIEKIANVNNRQVTFSKRRCGLFKKAAEICILTGARVALIVQSAGKRVYSFGYPDIDSVIAAYQNGYEIPAQPWTEPELHHMKLHNDDYNNLCLQLEAEKRKLAALENAGDGPALGSEIPWFEKPLDGMSLEELYDIQTQLEELKKNVENSLNDVRPSQPLALAITNNSVDHHDFSQSFEVTNNASDYNFNQPIDNIDSSQPLALMYDVDLGQPGAATSGNFSDYFSEISQPMEAMNIADVDSSLSLMFNVGSTQAEAVTATASGMNSGVEDGGQVGGGGGGVDDETYFQNFWS